MKQLKFYRFLPAIIFFIITFYLFTLPGYEIPQINWANEIQVDKLVHIGLFFILIILLAYPFNKSTATINNREKWFVIFAVAGITYGIAVEFIQEYYIVNRSFSILDMMADATGCIIGYYCAKWLFLK